MVIALMAGSLIRLGLARRARIRTEERTWQAEWLAESGLERAAARLAADRDYRGETWEPSAEELGGPWSGRVLIEIEPERETDNPDGPPTFHVRARADYPFNALPRARRTRAITVGFHTKTPNAGGER